MIYSKNYYVLFYLLIFSITAVCSIYKPYELSLWILESGFCFLGIIILLFSYRRFRFTNITYIFILIHFIILFIGAHYSYARVPYFDLFTNSGRNNYDKLGHFAQGFVPALISREILIRLKIVQNKNWIPFLVICICLAISAFYEFLEWWISIFSYGGAEDFLGMQGFIWDTQSDMFCAFIGSITMLLTLSKIQNRQILQLKYKKAYHP